jgi:FkbM family methyltransferase
VSASSAPTVTFTAAGQQVTLRFASAQDHIARTIEGTGTFYEAELLADVRSRLFFPECAVDVGAHVGNHTVFFSRILGIQTIAFEPNATSFAPLEANVRQNGVEGLCRLRRAAIGAAAGRVRAIASPENNSGMATVEHDPDGDVPLLCLDDELERDTRIDVIKIDVEGWELDVLRGAQRVLERHRPLLYVEAMHDNFAPLRTFLGERRYVCWKRFNATPTFLFMPNERLGAT